MTEHRASCTVWPESAGVENDSGDKFPLNEILCHFNFQLKNSEQIKQMLLNLQKRTFKIKRPCNNLRKHKTSFKYNFNEKMV